MHILLKQKATLCAFFSTFPVSSHGLGPSLSASAFSRTAEVYIGMSKPAEATACTQEAANLFPTSHNVLYMRGQIAELKGNIDEAKRWYEEALSINPTHVKTMQRLVRRWCFSFIYRLGFILSRAFTRRLHHAYRTSDPTKLKNVFRIKLSRNLL